MSGRSKYIDQEEENQRDEQYRNDRKKTQEAEQYAMQRKQVKSVENSCDQGNSSQLDWNLPREYDSESTITASEEGDEEKQKELKNIEKNLASIQGASVRKRTSLEAEFKNADTSAKKAIAFQKLKGNEREQEEIRKDKANVTHRLWNNMMKFATPATKK